MIPCTRPPRISHYLLEQILKGSFPFLSVDVSSIEEFSSYADRIYYFRATNISNPNQCKNEYTIKFLNSEDSEDIEEQQALAELKQFVHSKGLQCPIPVQSSLDHSITILSTTHERLQQNNPELDSMHVLKSSLTSPFVQQPAEDLCLVYVSVFLPGVLLSTVPHPPELMYSLGMYVATLNTELKEFTHSLFSDRKLYKWDLKFLSSLRELLYSCSHLSSTLRIQIIEKIIQDFETHVMPLINYSKIEMGIIHNDFNDHNVIISTDGNRIVGLIDYSECVKAPYIFEVGIAISDLMIDQEKPVECVVPFLKGYMEVLPLSQISMDTLYYVVLGRLVQLYVNGIHCSMFDEDNSYVLADVETSWILLEHLLVLGKKKCDDLWNIKS